MERARARAGWTRKMVTGLLGGAAFASTLVVGALPSAAIVTGPNGLIAFESSRTGNNEIFIMNPDGSVPVNLTTDKANDVFPSLVARWHPDHVQQ